MKRANARMVIHKGKGDGKIMLTALLKRVCVGCKCKDSRILELEAALRFSYEQMQRHDDEMAELQQQLDCIDLAI